jgi:hypothetical protein
MSPRINGHYRVQATSAPSTDAEPSLRTGSDRRGPKAGYSLELSHDSGKAGAGVGASKELYPNFHELLRDCNNKLLEMIGHPEQWADPDEEPPNRKSAERALRWLHQMYGVTLRYKMPWKSPHIGVDENGDISFEWWRGTKKLTIYVTPEEVEYVQVSGPDIIEDMDDGVVDSPEERRDLWAWLEEVS